MSFLDDQHDEFRDLLAKLSEERLTADETVRLEELVRADEQACWTYLKYIDLIGALHWEGASEGESLLSDTHDGNDTSEACLDLARLSNLPVPAVSTDQEASPASRPRWRMRRPDGSLPFAPLSLVVAGVVVGALLAVLAVWAAPRFRGINLAEQAAAPASQTYVARLTETINCVWTNEDDAIASGTYLTPGRKIELQDGLAEVLFDSGTRVILEGPCRFALGSENDGSLNVGKLAAQIPPEAVGFTLHTPSTKVIDLGTEFGAWVKENGGVEVHVFKGMVQLESTLVSNESGRTILFGGNAASVDPAEGGRPVQIPFKAERFVQQMLDVSPENMAAQCVRGSYDGTYNPDRHLPTTDPRRWQVYRGKGLKIVPNMDGGTPTPGVADFLDTSTGACLRMFRVHTLKDWGRQPDMVEYEYAGRFKIGKKTQPVPGHHWAYQVFGFRDEGGWGKIVALGWFHDLNSDNVADDPGLALVGKGAKRCVTVSTRDFADDEFHEYRVRKFLDRDGEMKIQVLVDDIPQFDPPVPYSELEIADDDFARTGFGLFSGTPSTSYLVVDQMEYHALPGKPEE